jgi:tyrosine-protein kinase Etk/Wzc
VGIEEPNITGSVAKITDLAIQRQNLEYTTQPENILFKDVDRQIDAEKNVLLEILKATRNTINIQLGSIQNKIAQMEAELRELPEEEQEFLKIQRQINISQQAYDVFLARRSEAAISKAANVSDIKVIDAAKDIGGGKIGPNTTLNYMMGLMIGFFAPMFIIFVVFLLDNTIHGSDQVTQLSSIPIIGLIGKYPYKNNLVVLEKPKSAVAESFRAIRSSLQFIYQNLQTRVGGRTLMITSSVSGEGKTFTSINVSTAYALSGKKTILLGLDLRKPKIFGDFNINNELGIVNHLIGEQHLE